MDIIEFLNRKDNHKKRNSKLLAKASLFNLYSEEFLNNPYPSYHRLRDKEPIHLSFMGAWILTRYQDIVQVLQDDINFTANRHPSFFPAQKCQTPLMAEVFENYVNPVKENLMLWIDPPQHTRIRSLSTKIFKDFLVNSLSDTVTQTVNELLEKLQEKKEQQQAIDLYHDLAKPLPIKIIASIMGIPQEDVPRVSQWSQKTINFVEYNISSSENTQELVNVLQEFSEYLDDLIEQKRQNPQSDFISHLVSINDRDKLLTNDEVRIIFMLLFPAGEVNTSNQIANCLLTLLRCPQQIDNINQQSISMTKVVEELIRYDASVQGILRITANDVNIAEQTIPKGKQVLLMLGAGNRDPEYFNDPDQLNFDRQSNSHLGFLRGRHNCLGKNLARMEIKIVLEKILPILPQLKLATEDIMWQKSPFFRGPQNLPVIFNQELN